MKLIISISQANGLENHKVTCPDFSDSAAPGSDIDTVKERLEKILFKLTGKYPINYYSPVEALVEEASTGNVYLFMRKGTSIPSRFNWELVASTK